MSAPAGVQRTVQEVTESQLRAAFRAVVCSAAVVALYFAVTANPIGFPEQSQAATAAPGASAALDELPVKGRAPSTGYERGQFGEAWYDADGNGCDTRNDVLQRDLVSPVLRDDGCTVQSGVLRDPYTGKSISFRRGRATSSKVQIDHVVSLSNAWQTGAQKLDPTTRLRFANDPLNLLAVDGATNQAKGPADAATWLPPRKAYRCGFVARQIAVKTRYGLWVTRAERDAMRRVLSRCPAQPLPSS